MCRLGIRYFWLLLLLPSWIACCNPQHPRSEAAVKVDREVVVLVHGMGRTRASMLVLSKRLKDAGYQTENFPYNQASSSLNEISSRLIEFIRENEKISRYHLIGHSLGNVIIRDAFKKGYPPGLGRIVMLGPPNRPAHLRLGIVSS